MSSDQFISDAGLVSLALCSPFGLSPAEIDSGLAPLKPSEWNRLARQLETSAIKDPAALAPLDTQQLTDALGIETNEAERIRRLLDRAERLKTDLDPFFAQGLWLISRADETYPARLRGTLKDKAPAILFGAGEPSLLNKPAVAVVGSRNIDQAGTRYAAEIGRKAARASLAVVSGGARGTDRIAMNGAIEAGGIALGALADSLQATVRKPDVQELVSEGRLALVTPYAPDAGFSVGAAMGRNKIIYGLAEYAVVVSSDFETGGTWAGAVEALKGDWCPVFVRDGEDVPKGNRGLIKLGAIGLSEPELSTLEDLAGWMQRHVKPKPVEQELF